VVQLRLFCSLCLIALAGVLVALAIGSCAKVGLAKLKPCRLSGIDEELLCGKLSVFENRSTHAGRRIDLNVVVLPAFDQKTKTEPLFDLAGGPGAASTDAATLYATQERNYRQRHDIVLVDQRGTGKSNPLSIPREKTPQYYLSEMYPVDHVRQLRQALEKRADLTQYTTSIAMDDLDEVRAWLGYDRINLFGSSYGTRAALVYMRQHPQRVHTATLIGVAPTYLKMPLHHSEAAARAIDLLFAECEQDSACHDAFPEIRQDWANVLAKLGRDPARVAYSQPEKPRQTTTVEIQRDIFAEKIRTWMYGRDKASRIPLIIHQAAAGNFEPFLQQAIAPSIPDFVADGTYLSVTCAEDVPFIDQAEAARLNANNPFGNYRVFQQTRACGMWPRGEVPPGFDQPVLSNAPVLIVSGNLDPVTPPQRGEEVAKYLPNSRHVIIREAGHGLDGLSDQGCVDRIIIDFLDKADPWKLDVSCVGNMTPPPFATK